MVKSVDFGVYLDGGSEFDEILLPIRYVPEEIKIGESVEVFIYTDSEDRIIATTEKPKAAPKTTKKPVKKAPEKAE